MIAFICFALLLCAPVLQGVWGFQTQFVFEATGLIAGGLYFFRSSRIGTGFMVPAGRNIYALLSAGILVLAAFALSPIRELVFAEWMNFVFGLFVFFLSINLSAEERKRSELGLRASAWILIALSMYQAFVLKSHGISASLTNPNALALFALMLIPLAVIWRDFFLVGALVIVLIWTQSAAGLLALLVSSGFYVKDSVRREELKKNWWLFSALAIIAILAVSQLEPKSFLDRLRWWGAAGNMVLERPLFGFGHGAFTYIYPAFHTPVPGQTASVYVHNYYLEFMAENGLPAFMCWFGFIFLMLRRSAGLIKYSIIAALVHSCVDFGLAVPANMFVFCYILGASAQIPLSNVKPSRGAVLASATIAALVLVQGVFILARKNTLERMHSGMLKEYSVKNYSAAELILRRECDLEPEDPRLRQFLGQVLFRSAVEKRDKKIFFSAAVEFERALLMNPFNPAAYRYLEEIYALSGAELADGLRQRRNAVLKWKK